MPFRTRIWDGWSRANGHENGVSFGYGNAAFEQFPSQTRIQDISIAQEPRLRHGREVTRSEAAAGLSREQGGTETEMRKPRRQGYRRGQAAWHLYSIFSVDRKENTTVSR